MMSALVLIACLFGGAHSWVNDFDEDFIFTCPEGRSISVFQSEHADRQEDRRFDFQCSDFYGDVSECYWTEYLNGLDETFTYECDNNYFLSGIDSIHENRQEDRQFKAYCCAVPGFEILDCNWTPYVNDYDEAFTYIVDDSKVMCGFGSMHENRQEERRFEFYECEKPIY